MNAAKLEGPSTQMIKIIIQIFVHNIIEGKQLPLS